MAVLLLISYWKSHWLHIVPGHQNPFTRLFVASLSLPKATSTLSNPVPSLTVTTTFHLGWT